LSSSNYNANATSNSAPVKRKNSAKSSLGENNFPVARGLLKKGNK
jgi:hypothetical protein